MGGERMSKRILCICFGTIFLVMFSSGGLSAQGKADILSVGLYQELSSFDPHTSTTTDQDIHLLNVYESLVGMSDADPADFKPVLAESWSVSKMVGFTPSICAKG